MVEVRWSKQAISDLEHLVSYLAQDAPARAISYLGLFQDATQRLRDFPKLGVCREDDPRVRELLVRPFVVGYRFEENIVTLVGIVHERQIRPW